MRFAASLEEHVANVVMSCLWCARAMQTFKSFEGFKAVAPVSQAPVARAAQFAFRRMPLKIEAARVGGVEIPNQKFVEYSLQYVYGIGHTTAKAILHDTVSVAIAWRMAGRRCWAARHSRG
jgi:hypothetical protein